MNFADTYLLPRAGRYANPLNSNDRLPLVYGDLTDGAGGNWELPCIDTVNYVYCFAASAVLSVANGNSINIYADDELVNPANYTFNDSNNYESQGNIATITFSADQENKIITARGRGKDDAGTLIENIVDIVDDFLTVENDFSSSDFEGTAKARAKALFTAQGYKAAGVIDSDIKYWELMQRMMGSFLGSIYFNAEKKLIVEIDDGTTIQEPAAIIPKAEILLAEAVQRIANLINQCPASYAYDYSKQRFRSHDDGSSYINTQSQSMYGTQKPSTPYQFYWCRDLSSIQTMQNIITSRYGDPVWEIDFEDDTQKRVHIDAGDIVAATFDTLFDAGENELINEFVQILSIKPDFDRGKIKFRGIDTGLYMTVAYLADGTYDADGSIMAGGNRDTTIY